MKVTGYIPQILKISGLVEYYEDISSIVYLDKEQAIARVKQEDNPIGWRLREIDVIKGE